MCRAQCNTSKEDSESGTYGKANLKKYGQELLIDHSSLGKSSSHIIRAKVLLRRWKSLTFGNLKVHPTLLIYETNSQTSLSLSLGGS